MYVQIPLFQAIKDIHIYGKAIREAFLKNPRRMKKDPTIVHVVGQLANIMLGKLITPKYFHLGSPVVNISSNGQSIKNTLIDLGASINFMTKDTMKNLKIEGLRAIPTVLQLVDSSTVTPDWMIENIVVTLVSLEYPANFMILSPKVDLSSYPIILG